MQKKVRFCPATIFLLILAIFNLIGMIGTMIIGGSVFISLLNVLFEIYFCIILFMKKRGIPTFIALAAFAVLKIVSGAIIPFVAYALLFVLALSACEKRIIKTNFFKKIHFVPGLLIIVDFIVNIITVISVIGFQGFVIALPSYILRIIEMIVLFLVGKWLAYPYGKGAELADVTEAVVSEPVVSEEAEA